MDKSDMKFLATLLLGSCAIIVVIGVVTCALVAPFKWQEAEMQAAIYERQGVHVTAEELFWGAKPIVPTYQSSKVDLTVEQR